LVDLFFSQGIKDVAVLINESFREDFEWWKKRYYPNQKIELFEEKKPLGTFGGLYFLKDWVSNKPFFLTNGDELKRIDLNKMSDFHQKIGSVGTVALVKVFNPQDYGVAICKSNFIKDFSEKPKNPTTQYVSSGLYLFSPEIFKYHPGPKFLMLERNIFPKLAKEKKLAGFKFIGKWIDCGTWERYTKAQEKWP
jgi:NDP-sugar pyrophosphorylase family protein